MSEERTSPSTSDWLRELGAVRPMAPAGESVWVLGPQVDGVYAIECRIHSKRFHIEEWHIFGIPALTRLGREQCERILKATKVQS